ncbi:MAG: signal recognition particle protein [Verrucomicrobiota bacterium]
MSALADQLQGVFKKLRGYGKLNEENVSEAVRDVRKALLAADVNYRIAKDFCQSVKEKALGEEVSRSIRPGDLFVKIVHDELLEFFGAEGREISAERPLRLALCGLNGAGKTTTAAKLAGWFKKNGESVVLIAADLSRPAAIDQLEKMGRSVDVPVLVPGQGDDLKSHLKATEESEDWKNADVRIYDLAGRTELDESLMAELESALNIIQPKECLLVADAALGQAAVEVATQFNEKAPLSGLILSKFDGDARGGAALSMQAVTGAPVKFLGTGERADQIEVFEPERLIKRLLGMGDLMGIAEKVQESINVEDAMRIQERMMSKTFDLQDFLDQMRQLKKLGPLQNLLGMMPGMSNIPRSAFDENVMRHTEAIVCSMTRQERKTPGVLNAKRRIRIAEGSGTSVREVNELMKRFKEMKKMMSKTLKGGNAEAKLSRMLSQGMK